MHLFRIDSALPSVPNAKDNQKYGFENRGEVLHLYYEYLIYGIAPSHKEGHRNIQEECR